MRVVVTRLCNMRLGPPKGTLGEGVGHLPSMRTEIDGIPLVISWWKPSAVERMKIAAGGLVRLSVYGKTTAPTVVEADPDNCTELVKRSDIGKRRD